ncbi:MAG: response regulator transcription factor [Chloroflexi bacterium]|nr:response regulator transcription factor [Chloroflexota bacterium]
MDKVRVFIVDDHDVVRAGLRAVLADAEGLEVVGEAATASSAVDRVRALEPDVVLMDVRLGGEGDEGGIDACRAVLDDRPDTRVLMFSSYGERETVVSSILAGAAGYLTKNVGRAQLIEALRAVGRGESLLDPEVTGPLLERLKELSAKEQPPDHPLSPREREVLALIARGQTNREIAEALVISHHTARNHVASILDKLGLSRRAEAAAFAAREDLLSKK